MFILGKLIVLLQLIVPWFVVVMSFLSLPHYSEACKNDRAFGKRHMNWPQLATKHINFSAPHLSCI